MTIEKIYTVKSSFIARTQSCNGGNVYKVYEETDIVKANSPKIAEAWIKAYYNGVWKDDLTDWIMCNAKPVFITDLSFIPEC